VQLLTLLTGVLYARGLGPAERGDLAAVIVVLTLVPFMLDFGFGQFVVRERARGTPRNLLLGTFVPIGVAFSLLGVAAASPVGHLIGGDRDTVVHLITIGLVLSPISIFILTVAGIPWGEQRWRLAAVVLVTAALFPFLMALVLYLAGEMTVTAVVVTVIASNVAANLPLLGTIVRSGRWRFDRALAGRGMRFGAAVWVSNVSAAGALYLDQLIMAPVLPARELGHYVVAITMASFARSLVTAVGGFLAPAAATGAPELVARSSRMTLGVVSAAALALIALAPWLVPFAFGEAFRPSVGLSMILLAAAPLVGVTTVLTAAIAASGAPGATSRARLLGLAITLPPLIFLLPTYGAVVAAITSSVAYAATGLYLVRAAAVHYQLPLRDFLQPRREDLEVVLTRLRRDPAAG
jgi:O-antigen/teichoic acid export membrane protein